MERTLELTTEEIRIIIKLLNQLNYSLDDAQKVINIITKLKILLVPVPTLVTPKEGESNDKDSGKPKGRKTA